MLLCVLQALQDLREEVEEIPCVIGGQKVYTGNLKKQVSVSEGSVTSRLRVLWSGGVM